MQLWKMFLNIHSGKKKKKKKHALFGWFQFNPEKTNAYFCTYSLF